MQLVFWQIFSFSEAVTAAISSGFCFFKSCSSLQAHLCVCVLESTSEPFGVVFDRAKGGAVAQAAIDHRVNGQEVRHSAGEEASIWERDGCARKSKRRRLGRRAR